MNLNRLSIVSGHCPVHSEIIGKASRIIAKLAKVDWRDLNGQYLPVINNGFVESLIKCRAIAEEGTNNG